MDEFPRKATKAMVRAADEVAAALTGFQFAVRHARIAPVRVAKIRASFARLSHAKKPEDEKPEGNQNDGK